MTMLRYDLRQAFEAGYTDHPQKVMESLGCKVLAYEGVPIADCAFIEVDKLPDPLPEFLTLSAHQIR